jgi:putative transposase
MHVTQRGVNRCAIFLDDEDRRAYLHLLRGACRSGRIVLHAYVLMDNHVHLLVTPGCDGGMSSAMHRLGQMYVQAFNARHGRVGTLLQGRFKSCLVDSDAYLLAVIRYIELNPVRAAMVERAEDFRWSSVHAHLGLRADWMLTTHATYLGLGASPAIRAVAWRRWLDQAVDEDERASIRRYLARGSVLGDVRFQEMVERALNRPVVARPRGRPAKAKVGLDEG